MKRRFVLIAIMIVSLLIASALGACTLSEKPPEPDEHQHTFSTEWSSNRNNHWHRATCEHEDLIEDEGVHIFDENHHCTVCGYTLSATAGLLREENEDGTWSIVGIDRYETETIIIVPEQYDGKDVTTIGEGVFQNRTSMIEIVLPDTITKIEDSAFEGCNGLKEVKIPDSVTYIGNSAFKDCKGLQLLTVGNSVTEVYADAFEGCDALSMVDVSDLTNWCFIDFEDAESNPLSNGGNVYENGISMNSLVLPNTVSGIKQFAFYGSNISEVSIPATTDFIGIDAFDKCESLKSVNYEGEISDWCEITFESVYANPISIAHKMSIKGSPVTELEIPQTVLEICEYAFYGLDMTSLVLREGIEHIGDNAFRACSSIINLNIPGSVKDIGEYAFYECVALKNLVLNEGLSTIGANAFSGCRRLYNVVIPNTVININNKAFCNCINLLSVTIGQRVAVIETSAFEGCLKLIEVRNLSDLDLKLGLSSNGMVSMYASNIYRSASGSRLKTENEDYIFYCGTENYFMEYKGDSSTITLPDYISDASYSIYQYAFSYNNFLTTINIPETILSIGKGAFENCEKLQYKTDANIQYLGNEKNPYMIILKGEANVVNCDVKEGTKFITGYAFSGCTDLERVKFSNTIINLGEGAFENCSKLQEVTLSSSLAYIADYAFRNCAALKSIEFPPNIKEIGEGAFAGCTQIKVLNIPDTIETLGVGAFAGCEITDLTIGAEYLKLVSLVGVERLNVNRGSVIEKNVFKDNATLKEITLAEGITTIEDSAFESCVALRDLSLPTSISKIGNRAFYGCSELGEISLSNNIVSIGDFAFESCGKLKGYTHGDFEYLGSSENEYLILYKVENKSITDYTSNSNTKFINDYAFSGCANLTNIKLGDNVLQLGNYAFEGCKELGTVEIGSKLKNIRSYVFSGCSNLQSIDISKSVESIGDYAFKGCTELKNISLSNALRDFGDSVFNGCNKLSYYTNDGFSYLGNPSNNYIILMKASPTMGKTYDVKSGTLVIYDNAFEKSNCTEIGLPTSLKVIGSSAFASSQLEKINFSEGLERIGSNAFNNTKLVNFILPDSVTQVGANVITGCQFLEVVYFAKVTEASARISSERDANGLFSGCVNLHEVYMPYFTEIGSHAFEKIKDVRKLVIGKSLRLINSYAFRWTYLFRGSESEQGTNYKGETYKFLNHIDIYYEGTANDWELIDKRTDWDDQSVIAYWNDSQYGGGPHADNRSSFHFEEDVYSMRPEV